MDKEFLQPFTVWNWKFEICVIVIVHHGKTRNIIGIYLIGLHLTMKFH